MNTVNGSRFTCRSCGEPLRKCVDSRMRDKVRTRVYRCASCGHSQGTIEIERDYIYDSHKGALEKFQRQMIAEVDTEILVHELGKRILESTK
jgi:predicted RNA-binding Zn-ribbon protein involved in translation (DUF1610 family)